MKKHEETMISLLSCGRRGEGELEHFDKRIERAGRGVGEAGRLVWGRCEFVAPLAGEYLEGLRRVLRANEGVGKGLDDGCEDAVRTETLR